ncbi:ROK family protein [Rhizobium sp. P32RR-XVIII]|uniref:ROK family transcriptional regulator n=1 Tax=Rhizobium sp. P32RR-XVIII TaxID=2726738 RepID=UPI0014572812|nr:ROK family transcriptional regulator [Rhizobium sp. P32RR-XVIII]NLS04053.1 ROK family protein [Rhizobium sp. P32RR-XVIII]
MTYVTGLSQKDTYAHNLRAVFEVIRVHGPMTIAEIAPYTGLTVQTISNLTGELDADGFIRSPGRIKSRRGQPPKQFTVNESALCSIGVHLERGYYSALLTDLSGRTLRREASQLHEATPEAALLEIAATVRKLQTEAGSPVAGVGLALPGPLSLVEGRVRSVPNYPGWDDVPVSDILRGHTGLPVFIENDATAAAIGELRHGGARGCQDFFYIYFGTNLGGGIISNGAAMRGATANAGEFGRLLVGNMGGPEVNHIVSFAALRRAFPGITKDEVALRLNAEDADLITWLENACDALLAPIHAVENLLDPERIVLGGEFPDSVFSWLATRLAEKISNARPAGALPPPAIDASFSDGKAAALGAAALPVLAALSLGSLSLKVASETAALPLKQPAFWQGG